MVRDRDRDLTYVSILVQWPNVHNRKNYQHYATEYHASPL